MATSERDAREARLAQALRANLRRRKGQARARAEEDSLRADEEGGEGTSGTEDEAPRR